MQFVIGFISSVKILLDEHFTYITVNMIEEKIIFQHYFVHFPAFKTRTYFSSVFSSNGLQKTPS